MFFLFKNHEEAPPAPEDPASNKENITQIANTSLNLLAYEEMAKAYKEEVNEKIRSAHDRIKERKTKLLKSEEWRRESDLAVSSSLEELQTMKEGCSKINGDLDLLILNLDLAAEKLEEESGIQRQSAEELTEIDQTIDHSKIFIREVSCSLDSISRGFETIESNQSEIRQSHAILSEDLISSRARISNLQKENLKSKIEINNFERTTHDSSICEGFLEAIHHASNFSLASIKRTLKKCNYKTLCHVSLKVFKLASYLFSSLSYYFTAGTKQVGAWVWNFMIGSIPTSVWVVLGSILTYKATQVMPPRHVFIVISSIAIYEYFFKHLILDEQFFLS